MCAAVIPLGPSLHFPCLQVPPRSAVRFLLVVDLRPFSLLGPAGQWYHTISTSTAVRHSNYSGLSTDEHTSAAQQGASSRKQRTAVAPQGVPVRSIGVSLTQSCFLLLRGKRKKATLQTAVATFTIKNGSGGCNQIRTAFEE